MGLRAIDFAAAGLANLQDHIGGCCAEPSDAFMDHLPLEVVIANCGRRRNRKRESNARTRID